VTPVADVPAYAVVGRGHWAARMEGVLGGEGRTVHGVPEARRRPGEDAAGYEARMGAALAHSGAEIAWICVPPGAHIPCLVRAALMHGLHVVVEKPWMSTPEESAQLAALAVQTKRVIGVHYEYCLLDGVGRWRAERSPGAGLRFGGSFDAAGADRLGIPPLWNLGSHLLAIREYAVPAAAVSDISCGYDRPPARRAWLTADDAGSPDVIDFGDRSEPIIQRFVARFEDAVRVAGQGDAAFPFDLDFATRVAAAVEGLIAS